MRKIAWKVGSMGNLWRWLRKKEKNQESVTKCVPKAAGGRHLKQSVVSSLRSSGEVKQEGV